jgi:adenylate kinase
VRIIILGCPGAGKGTQAQQLAKRLGIPLVSTGDMLRQTAGLPTQTGLKIKAILASGALLSDDIIIELVKERLVQKDCENGYILDGFPRTIAQAEALDKCGITLDRIIEVFVPDDEIVDRLTGRRIHLPSGRVYHIKHNPPKVPGKDDLTGEALAIRDDDQEKTVRERLKIYHEKTEPLINYYQKLQHKKANPHYTRVPGTGKINEIQNLILASL